MLSQYLFKCSIKSSKFSNNILPSDFCVSPGSEVFIYINNPNQYDIYHPKSGNIPKFYLDTSNHRFCVKCKYNDTSYNGSFALH